MTGEMPDDLVPERERGTHRWPGEAYGRSLEGAELRVWLPISGKASCLVFAGIHGNEPDTTVVLSAALRTLPRDRLRAAVVVCANPDGAALGVRGNARGVDLNRNFPTRDFTPRIVLSPWADGSAREMELSAGSGAASEPETRGLIELVERLGPRVVVSIHSDLACIDDPGPSELGRWLSQRTGLPLVPDIGYATPGSFGTWCVERGLPVVTYELEANGLQQLRKRHVDALIEVLAGESPLE
jgi:protein MpaA